MKHLRVIVFTLLVAFLATPIIALASDISGAKFWAQILVSNNGTATTNVATTVSYSLNTTNLINGNYLNAGANNSVMRSSAGADLPFQPGYTPGGFPWCVFVPSIGANSYLTDILYTANSTGGEERYFPASSGMTTSDSGTLEPGDNFTYEMKGFVDTAVSGDIVGKHGAFEVVTDGIGNVTASIPIFFDDFSIDNWTDVGTKIHVTVPSTRIDYEAERSAIDERCHYDYTSISDTEWVMEFIWTPTAYAAAGRFNFGFFDALAPPAGYGGDLITFEVEDVARIYSVDNGGGPIESATIAYALGTTYYVTFERVSAILMRLSIFTDEARTTHTAGSPVTLAITATTVSLRYIQGANWHDGIGAAQEAIGWLTDLEIDRQNRPTVSTSGVSSGEYTVKVSGNSAFLGLGIDIGDETGFPSVSDNVVLNAPLWQTKLDGSPFTTVDINEHICTVTGAVWTSDGRVFDGNDYIDCGTDASLNFGTGNFTVTIWLTSPNVSTGVRRLVSKWDSDVNAKRGYILQATDGKMQGIIDSAVFDMEGATPLLNDVWYMYSMVRDGDNGYLYLDDAEDASTAGLAARDATSPRLLGIGALLESAQFITGTVGDVLLYNRALSPTEIQSNYNATKWKYIGSHTDDDFDYVYSGVSVPDNNSDWVSLTNDCVLYMEHQKIDVDGVQQQHIVWEYTDNFSDQSGQGHWAIPTFRTASSDADVSANMTAFLPIAEAKAPDYVLGVGVPFIDASGLTGNITAPFTVTPPSGGFPLADVIAAVAAATTPPTPAQLPLLTIAAFVILAASLTVSAIIRGYGSGSLIIKIITITAFLGIFIGLKNFGIDFWMLGVFLVISIALAMGSRQMGWT